MKGRPLVEVSFLFYCALQHVFRFYCCCYALAAKDLLAAMILVIDLFFMKITVSFSNFQCFKTKPVKESKGEINILLVILLSERILIKNEE